MNQQNSQETLREILRVALTQSAADIDATEYHPVDDDELLIEWSLGDLDTGRHQSVLQHLAECSYCRRELAAMCRAGAMTFPDDEMLAADSLEVSVAEPAAVILPVPSDQKVKSRRDVALKLAALAASVLIVIVWGLSQLPKVEQPVIAMAEIDLQEGRPETAFDRLDGYLSSGAVLDAERQQAISLLEQSGYRFAREKLAAEDFQKVLYVQERAKHFGGGSGRLVNLRLQAERGESTEHTLAKREALTDYDYELDGRQYFKDFTVMDDTARRIKKELADAVGEFPDSIDLRLNYGQFLLDHGDFRGAAKQFEITVQLDPQNALAQTGLGLALFQQETDESIQRARTHFEKAVALDPNDPEANLNLAVCLVRLGQKAEAEPYFRKSGKNP